MRTDVTRRRFLGLIGLGSAGVGGLAVISGCGSKAGTTAASSQPVGPATTTAAAAAASATIGAMPNMPGMSQSAPAQPAAQAATANEVTPAQMDQADLDKIQQFLQNTKSPITKGKGGVPLAYELDGDTKVFTLTTSKIKWETIPGQVEDAYAYNEMLP